MTAAWRGGPGTHGIVGRPGEAGADRGLPPGRGAVGEQAVDGGLAGPVGGRRRVGDRQDGEVPGDRAARTGRVGQAEPADGGIVVGVDAPVWPGGSVGAPLDDAKWPVSPRGTCQPGRRRRPRLPVPTSGSTRAAGLLTGAGPHSLTRRALDENGKRRRRLSWPWRLCGCLFGTAYVCCQHRALPYLSAQAVSSGSRATGRCGAVATLTGTVGV